MTETLTCTRCMGTGISNHPDSGETCYDCKGRGAIPEPIHQDKLDDEIADEGERRGH